MRSRQSSSPELRAALASYTAELESVSDLLHDAEKLSELPEADRHLLLDVFDSLRMRLQTLSPDENHSVIHARRTPYNVLTVDGEPRFIDFETTCIWCWAEVNRGDLRYHAEVHLARVKEIAAEYA